METPLFEAPKYKLIYVFRINDAHHRGCLKIGETTIRESLSAEQALALQPNASKLNKYARERINGYTKTASIPYDLLHTEAAVYKSGDKIRSFSDHDVHSVLLRSGINRKEFKGQGVEWFVTDLETAKNAIKAVKEGRQSLRGHEVSDYKSPIVFRPEQRDAIDRTKKHFAKGNQMLWNAKMRFGKTLSALQVIREMQFHRTLILTHRPVVDEGWFIDFGKIFRDTEEYVYGSRNKGESFANLAAAADNGKHIIYFASIQDMRGAERVGGKFDKNKDIYETPWDLIIIDEAHEGTQTELGKQVMAELLRPATKVLRLSGTPFNLINDFREEEIYTWDYVMEQRAKMKWDETHFGDPNPYAALPAMHIYTYDLGRLMDEFIDEDVAFNFREFFRVNDSGKLIHEKDVTAFLNLLVKDDKDNKSCYPFANDTFRDIFRHTFWTVPGVQSALALERLLEEHTVFQHFQIVNVAGDGDPDDEEKNREALDKVRKAIGDDPDETRTITLSCGRLTTGVTVPEWTGVLMLSGSYSTAASSYMQTIFRVQSPATINGHTKEDCYVFDFAPDRTLQVLATVPRVSTKAGKTTEGQREALGEFLNFCPVIAFEGSEMRRNKMTPDKMMEQLKRAYVERVVRSGFESEYLYSDELLKLTDIDIAAFDKLKGIIGTTKAIGNVGNIVLNDQGLTNEQYEEKEKLEKKNRKHELTEEEKKRLEELRRAKEGRDKAISILRGISVRMPLLVYGAEMEDENKELTIDNFATLVDDRSWEEFMPRGVTKDVFNKFKKYYDRDVFTAAGKRIRSLARSADRMPIEERIERIADIFATLRNPDKETVLTPWRVVNMHIGDTLGGYCFFDDKHEKCLEEPRYIDRGEITDEVFAPDTCLLEINSKTGLYPLYLAYSVYRRRLKELTTSPRTLKEHLKVWDKAVAENIFVICMSPMAKSITRRTLVGFRNAKVNTHYFKNLVNQLREKPDNFLSKVVKGKSYWKANNNDNMKIKAIVGNPPYQEVVARKETTNGQKVRISIFHHFQKASDKLGKYTSLIYPGGRWIHRSGKGLEAFGLEQINDPHLSLLIFFPDSTDVFPDVGIADGVSIVMKDMSKNESGFDYVYSHNGNTVAINAESPKEELFPLNPLDNKISECLIRATSKYACLHDSILPRSLFSIESNFVELNPTLVREYEDGDPYDAENEIKLFTNDKAGKSGRARWYIAKKDVITTGLEQLNRWKVIVSSANAGGQKRSNQIAVVDDHSAFGRSRVALKTFETEKEAQNFFKYATSEIIRFAFLLTDEALTTLAYKVPDLIDYTDDNGIVDYSKDVNTQLCKLFHIDERDQQYIKGVLSTKPM